MGIFQSRPEDPAEWAGLPAEPWEPRAPGEVLLPATPSVDVLSLLDGGGVGITLDIGAASEAETGPRDTAAPTDPARG